MESQTAPNPKRVAAGLKNWRKRKGLTPDGRERLRQAVLRNQPWKHSTGPRTPAGKARVAENGRVRQRGPISVRQLRAELRDVRALMADMRDARSLAGGIV